MKIIMILLIFSLIIQLVASQKCQVRIVYFGKLLIG